MGISDIYLKIGHKRNVSHFANIVKIAKSDNEVSEEEIAFLSKVSNKYNISNEQFKAILKNPESIPTIAHLDCVERIERLYDLLTMVRADDQIENEEVSVLRKIAVGLAFPLAQVDSIVDEAVQMNIDNMTVESFTEKILALMNIRT